MDKADTDDTLVIEESEDSQKDQSDESTDQSGDQNDDQNTGTEADSAEGTDEVVVTIGGDSPPVDESPAQAPEWVRELRKNHRELQRRNRELEERLKVVVPENKPVTLGPKPSLESVDYDAEKFEKALESWYEQKRKADEAQSKAEAQVRAEQQEWQSKVESYNKAKASLKVRDFDDAESTVQESLSATQQGIILQGAENPAVLIYALGKNPKKAKELASITDPVKYAFAVAKLETQLKVTQRKAPPPEKTVTGSAGISGTVDSTLARLRAEAEKTGDYTKVTQYKTQKRNTGK
jgi:hypothetical protein